MPPPDVGEVTMDRFDPLSDAAAIQRLSVTEVLASSDATAPAASGSDNALVGTLVHRLFQFGEGSAGALLRPEERATAGDPDDCIRRALAAWRNMMQQPDLTEILASSDLSFEVPFSFVDDKAAGCVLRGTIDCLARRPDGSVVVLEFKTGVPAPVHQEQLAIYCCAARTLFTETVVTGRVVYPTR